jgi:1,3-propanediol dehydrogenase
LILKKDFKEMAKYVLEDENAEINPRKGTVEQVKAIFEDAM